MATKKQDISPRDFADFETDIVQGLLSGKKLSGKDGVLANLIKHATSVRTKICERICFAMRSQIILPTASAPVKG